MILGLLTLMLLIMAACAPLLNTPPLPPDTGVTSPPVNAMPTEEPRANPLSPKSGDEQLTRGEAFINEMGLLIRESYPPQIALSVSGDLPTPCHELRAVVAEPDQENKITIEF